MRRAEGRADPPAPIHPAPESAATAMAAIDAGKPPTRFDDMAVLAPRPISAAPTKPVPAFHGGDARERPERRAVPFNLFTLSKSATFSR